MAERLILCSECGTKNRIANNVAGTPKCGSCGKRLAVPGYSGGVAGGFSKAVFWFVLGVMTVVGVLYYNDLGGYLTEVFHTTSLKPPSTPDEFALDSQLTGKKQTAPPPPTKNIFDQFDQPAPPEGFVLDTQVLREPTRAGVAPLLIKTSPGYDYYVKIVAPPRNEIMTIYIRGGEHIDTLVPLGSFEIRYAAGRKWYGQNLLFGEETAYSKADRLFQFSDDGQQYSGYTVELIMQSNGNLPVSAISAKDF